MVNCVVSCDLYYEFVVIRCTQRRRVVVSVDAQNRDAYVKKSEEPPPRKKLKLRHVIIMFNVQSLGSKVPGTCVPVCCCV